MLIQRKSEIIPKDSNLISDILVYAKAKTLDK
jgi:hypothetical protein